MASAELQTEPGREFLSDGGELGARMRALDWAATSLGPVERWPASLRAVISLLLTSRQPMFLAWGPDLTFLYNDAYAPILGGRHPEALGQPFQAIWAEIWDDIRPLVDRALDGESTWSEDLHLVMERNGYPEDTWYTFSYSPVRDESGAVAGMFCACTETTRQVQSQRLLRFKLDLNERLREVADPAEVTAVAAERLGRHLGVARVGYGEIDAEAANVSVERDWTDGTIASLAGVSRPLDSFGPGIIAVLRAGQTLVLDDIASDSRASPYAEGYAAIGARSMIVTPLIKAGRFLAVLYMHEPAPRRWTQAEVEHVEAVAGATWAAVERARAEAALREREQRLTLIQEAGGVGSFDWDMVTGRIHRSVEYLALQGLPVRSSLEGSFTDAWQDRLHPEDRDRVVAAFREDITRPGPFEREYRIVRPDTGEVRWINNRGRIEGDAAGRPVRMLSAQTDVTERKRTEAALRESEARFRNMADNAPALIWASDEAAQVTFANARYQTDYGLEPAEVLQSGWRKMVHADDVDAFFGDFLSAFEARRSFAREVRTWNRHGELRWLRCAGVPRFDGQGGFLGYVGCNIDVTEARVATERLLELNQTLEERVAQEVAQLERAQDALRQAQKMEAVGQLTGGIAHDFNNLLTAVVGGLDIISRRSTDERTRKLADNALQAAERGVKLTGQLLAFSRTQRLAVGPVDVNALVTGMRDLITGSIGGNVEIRTALTDGVGSALTDANQLELAILNLCINARDAMPTGGVVTVSTALETVTAGQAMAGASPAPGEYVIIAVSDDGPGMAPEVVARAFDPFFTTKPVGQGTGLGLSQVYGIALQSGGDARIESRLGEGTTVRLLLRRVDRLGTAPAAQAAAEAPEATGKRRLVLVVDDDPDVRRFVVDGLDTLGFRVLEAADGPTGLALFEQERPELLLLDFAMPGMTGAEVAAAARRLRPDQPVLFASGHADTAALESAAGDAAVLRKPFRLGELSAAVEAALAPI